MKSLIVHSCLSQAFVAEGKSVTVETTGDVFSYLLVLVMCKTLIMSGCKSGRGGNTCNYLYSSAPVINTRIFSCMVCVTRAKTMGPVTFELDSMQRIVAFSISWCIFVTV